MNSIGSVTRRLQRMVLSSSQVRREKKQIWDAILCDLPDKDLLRAACVCRAFNALCIAACLSRHSTLLHGQAPPADVIMDTFALHALRISSLQQPIQRLWCHFQNSDIFRHLAALVDFTRKSNDLRDVTVDFPVDLLAAPRLDAPSSKIPRAGSRRELLRELCAVLSVVALKTPGPVFVIAPGTVFTCRSKDVAGWRLDLLEFNGGTGPRELCKRMRRALRDKSPSHSPCPFTTVRLCSGEMWGTWAITEMHAASVRSFSPPRMLSTPYTVILLNFYSITSSLGSIPSSAYSPNEPMICTWTLAFLRKSILNSSSWMRRQQISPEPCIVSDLWI
ncbi:hypothetical protein B0H11DRAFT_2059395 [Mycena galericulata]|nr:hypothetical protein B0H11DRAFT_2059395 [Mycena galericulata]